MKGIIRYARAFAGAHLRRNDYPPGWLNYVTWSRKTDRRFFLKKHAKLGPVLKLWLGGKMATYIAGHQRAKAFLAANDGKLPGSTVDLSGLFPHGWIRAMEGDIHRKYRQILVRALHAAELTSHEDALRRHIRQGLDRIAEASVDGVADTKIICAELRNIATCMMFRLLFGVTEEDPLYGRLRRAYRAFGPDAPAARMKPAQAQAFAEIKTAVLRIADEIRIRPDDFPPCALKYLIETGNTSDETALGNLIYMFEPAYYDTHSLWRWILKNLSDGRSATDVVRTKILTRGRTARKHAEAVVYETLRMDQAERLMRNVAADIRFDGYHLPKDSVACISLWEVHKDPDAFDDPFRFDPMRFVDKTYDTDRFAPFGLDKHHCIGATVVVFSSALLVEELLSGYEWNVVADGKPRLGRFHWEPSPKFGIRLRRRSRVSGDLAPVVSSTESETS